MKIKTLMKTGTALGVIGALLIVLLLCGVSWIATCGVIKLVTLCFGWSFSWGIATGVWLVMCLARTVFKNNTTITK